MLNILLNNNRKGNTMEKKFEDYRELTEDGLIIVDKETLMEHMNEGDGFIDINKTNEVLNEDEKKKKDFEVLND